MVNLRANPYHLEDMALAPVCDIAYNWENTEIIGRSFGNDPQRVAKMSAA